MLGGRPHWGAFVESKSPNMFLNHSVKDFIKIKFGGGIPSMKKILFLFLPFLFISCATTSIKSSNIINEVETNHLFFDFSKEKKEWVVIKNQTTKVIDVTYLSSDESTNFVSANNWNYTGIFHTDLEPESKIETLNRGKCVIETANGNILKYNLSYLKNGIVINVLDFENKEVPLFEKELNIWAVNELNGTYNTQFSREKRYTVWAKFQYNDSLNSINMEDRYGQNPTLENVMCAAFLNEHPEIQAQSTLSKELFKFVFTKNDGNTFILSDIESIDWEKLKKIAELKETHLIYNGGYFLKVNAAIKDNAIPLSLRNPNFINNNPYGFKKDYYYYDEHHVGYVLQWINENVCLYDFAPDSVYTKGQGLSLVYFDSKIDNYPFKKNILYHYEGVYTYTTSKGGQNSIPKFRIIFEYDTLNKDKTNNAPEMEYISYKSLFFRNNNPYGLNKNTKYIEDKYSIKGKVLQWLYDGCLYDFSGGITEINWSCLVYLILPESDRNLFFDDSYNKYYKYEGVYSYETVYHVANTVPKLKVYFEKKTE